MGRLHLGHKSTYFAYIEEITTTKWAYPERAVDKFFSLVHLALAVGS